MMRYISIFFRGVLLSGGGEACRFMRFFGLFLEIDYGERDHDSIFSSWTQRRKRTEAEVSMEKAVQEILKISAFLGFRFSSQEEYE